MNNVILSSGAQESYRQILQFVYDYSVDAALELNDKMEKTLERLAVFKNLCPPSGRFPKFRKCVLDRHVSMIYEVQQVNRIVVVAFIDNRMDNEI
ncbi:MAG: type II toxin-antitoxin system RelE/ParE family toxin [Saprospiraceae bacterium]